MKSVEPFPKTCLPAVVLALIIAAQSGIYRDLVAVG
jgi:hypothetical protein